MKTRVKKSFILLLVMAITFSLFCLPVAAKELVSSVEANYSNGLVNVTGTVSSGELAVAVLIYDGDTLLRMETTGVDEDGAFETKISIKLSAGEYTVKVADYEGGPFLADAEFVVAASPSSGGGGGGGAALEPSDYTADNSEGDGLPVTLNTSGGKASVDLTPIVGDIAAGDKPVVTIPAIPGVSSYTAGLPSTALAGKADNSVTINTELGNVTLPGNMLAGTGLTGAVEITVADVDTNKLPKDVRDAVGNHPVIQLTMTVNGKQVNWNNSDAPVTVSIPYTPTAAELQSPESIVIWYLDGEGNIVTVPNGRYDAKTGTVTFTTTHFSDFAVAYNKVIFTDVAANAWYNKAVSFIAARNITTGTSSDKYSPERSLTRGQFIVMLMRAYSIEPDANSANNFADAGNTYYTDYLAAAKRLGISAGVGNNKYAPEAQITRQEMFTLLYNALGVIGELPTENVGKKLSDFSDASSVSSWANEAMTLLVKSGKVAGSGGKLSPKNNSTRAEMAQLMYNLFSN